MAYIFTPHIRMRMRQRGITQDQVEETIRSPQVKYTDGYMKGRCVHQREFRNRILKVVFQPEANDVYIITAHWVEPGGNP